MIQEKVSYKIIVNKSFNEPELLKGLYIAVIHATRIPPHIGMVIDKKYHSLSIKGQDINTSVAALIKNSTIRKIPSLFVKIKSHPTFSGVYLREHFITNIQNFNRVDIGIATCLSPLKLFFEEVYNIPMGDINYLYELLPALESSGLIESITSLNVDPENYQLPIYSDKEINAEIEQVRKDYKS